MPRRKPRDNYTGNDSEASNESDFYGEGLWDDMKAKIKSYASTVMYGRNDYPPKVRDIIKQYGDKQIKSITIDRTPVPGLLTGALNAVSFGAFKKKLEASPYDKLYHLRIDITFDNNDVIALEKNEVINAYQKPTKQKGSEQKQISFIPAGTTLNHMLEGGQKIQGQRWFKYSAYDNNCQDFILALLKGSNIGNDQDYNFIKQDTKQLFKDDPTTRKIANTVTDLGAKVNEITAGTGLENQHTQSVLFARPQWTKTKAVKWLKFHGLKHDDIDVKPEHLRFRQFEPNDRFKYYTKHIEDGVQYIVTNGFKKKTIGKGITMSSESERDSDTSSDSESSISEDEINKRIDKLSKHIKKHMHIHGGKINIARSFRKLGDTIKKGFKTAGHYVTAKKGGLASDLLHKGLPTVTGALAGAAAEALVPEGGPVSGFVGNQAGKYAGNKLADYIGSKTGTGMKAGDLIHIDIGSHNAKDINPGVKSKSTSGEGLRKRKKSKKYFEDSDDEFSHAQNTALSQMVRAHRKKEQRELVKNLNTMSKDMIDELRASRSARGGGFKKGSKEAKEHMARLRAMRKK